LIEAYISAASGLGGTQIDGGIWEFALYRSVNSTFATSKILIDVYKRSPVNVVTLLFSSSTGSIEDTAITLENIDTIQPSFSIDPSDRLVIKFSAYTTRALPTTISYTHNGNSRNSHFHTPLVQRHNDLAGLQGGNATEKYHLTLSELVEAQGMKDYVDASIENFATNSSVGLAIQNFATNSSVGLALSPINSSLNALGTISLLNFWTGTDASYLELGSYDSSTLYFTTA
jgi:hypothetical protein